MGNEIIKKLNHIYEYVHFIRDEFYTDSTYYYTKCKEIHMPEYGILFEGYEDFFTSVHKISKEYDYKVIIELSYDKVSDKYDILIRKFDPDEVKKHIRK